MRRLVLMPANPERVCWGCDKHCPADDLVCGNGTDRTPHPVELFGSDWVEWANELGEQSGDEAAADSEHAPSGDQAP